MPYLGKQAEEGGALIRSHEFLQGTDTSTGTSAFTVASTGGDYVRVFLNGVLLQEGASNDYTKTTSAVTITGTAPADGDILKIDIYESITIWDTVSAASGGTFTGDVTLGASDATYANNKALKAYVGTTLTDIIPGDGTAQALGTGDSPSFGALTLSTGNLVMASGQGIDFSATANSSGTMTSELLDDYEEGTWTCGYTAGAGYTGATITNKRAHYVKIGTQVSIWCESNAPTGTSGYILLGDTITLTSLPFSIAANTQMVASSNAPTSGTVYAIFSVYQASLTSVILKVTQKTGTAYRGTPNIVFGATYRTT